MTDEREKTLRSRLPWILILVALGAIGLFNLQVFVLSWPVWVEVPLFMVAYGGMYEIAEWLVFRKSDD